MHKTRTHSSVLAALQRDARIPLHRQIETSIRDAIRAGRLPRGSSLPPSRVLAADLGVSRGVVVEAYQQLASEGYLASYAGGYTQVAAGPAPTLAGLRLARETPPRIDLSYGRADVSSFPRAAWLRAIRGALASAPNDRFGAVARAAGRGAALGRRERRDRHRGRLRLRVPLRPDTGRRPAGNGPGPGGVRRVGQQDPRAGAAARVVRHAGAPGRADGRG